MKTRVLETHDRNFIPQAKFWYGIWHRVTDTIRDEELESEDDYDYDFDEQVSAETCAIRYAAHHGGIYIGYKHREAPWHAKLKRKVRNYFTGPTGYQGAMGAQGLQGPRGRDAHDLMCPHCNKSRLDSPAQPLLLQVESHGFIYTCNKCEKDSVWKSVNGVLLEESTVVQPA